ncbi:phosphatidylserine decarboxylase [Candidatus Chlamydia sanziniae]|uniref:Phosphatidylserine decarboxylase proenzyme n=1 Tax=Candidatus Chlamydia sanziniae TaxID=1806891 RepID=A0A1A9HXI3_9CHLA|nr:phosphatidylserine decarboxylase [Candidatus Chlamydia sanziniae]ANH78636.1 Phosphatidylserine decarboxylase [Candidatus Chlamydia sanziniae]
MQKPKYIDRITGERVTEPIFYEKTMMFLYNSKLGRWLAGFFSTHPIFSRIYGWVQKQSWTRGKIRPFVQQYNISEEESVKPVSAYTSFNDFFTRKLKRKARPIFPGDNVCITPADGRYLIYSNASEFDEFVIKSKRFSLSKLLGDNQLVKLYAQGSMVFIRLAPFDYHRFHFPCDCLPQQTRCINGSLFSVHPLAIKDNFILFCENKRTATLLETKGFGNILYLEVGAMNIGSITQTFSPNQSYCKGAEKGFFSFGGSTIILLFLPNVIRFDEDLLKNSRMGLETRCLMGQSLGRSQRE